MLKLLTKKESWKYSTISSIFGNCCQNLFFQWSEASDFTMISANGGTCNGLCAPASWHSDFTSDWRVSFLLSSSSSHSRRKRKKNCALQLSKNGVNVMCRTQLSSRKWWVGQASTLEYQWLETADADLPTVVSRSIAKSHAFACRHVGWSHAPFPGT